VAGGRLKDIGVSLPLIRQIVKNCQDLFQVERPLVMLRFKTDGGEIFVPQGDALLAGMISTKTMVAPRGFGRQASLFEVNFEGLATIGSRATFAPATFGF
jgi:hypothetical protein